MIDASTLGLFVLAVLALFASPGPNMAFVLSHGLAHGVRGGFAAAVGITAADLVHTLLAATGVTAMVVAWPPSFDVLRYAGAAYLLWLGWQALRAAPGPGAAQAGQAGFLRIVQRAWLNNLVNPKALLFFVVFLPQFVDSARGHVTAQLLILGATLSAMALVFNTLLGAFSGSIGQHLASHTGMARWQQRTLAVAMASLALRLVFLDRPVKGS
jgi:threonine/homoserine/homoserine lactone efflux protein